MGWSLAASLAIHGIAVGGLVLSARPGSQDLPHGEGAPGAAAAGGPVFVRLLEAPAARGEAGASAGVSLPLAGTRWSSPAQTAEAPKRTEPRRAPAASVPLLSAASDPRPRREAQRPPATSLETRATADVASAPASTPQPLTRPDAAAGTPLSQKANGVPFRPSGPGGGPLPNVDLGPGTAGGDGRLDRVARPAGAIRPHYPARARQRGEEADVTLDVWVGARGDVDQVAVSKSAGAEFDAAALAAVEKAHFHPALRDGRRVPSRVALRLHFRLQ